MKKQGFKAEMGFCLFPRTHHWGSHPSFFFSSNHRQQHLLPPFATLRHRTFGGPPLDWNRVAPDSYHTPQGKGGGSRDLTNTAVAGVLRALVPAASRSRRAASHRPRPRGSSTAMPVTTPRMTNGKAGPGRDLRGGGGRWETHTKTKQKMKYGKHRKKK